MAESVVVETQSMNQYLAKASGKQSRLIRETHQYTVSNLSLAWVGITRQSSSLA